MTTVAAGRASLISSPVFSMVEIPRHRPFQHYCVMTTEGIHWNTTISAPSYRYRAIPQNHPTEPPYLDSPRGIHRRDLDPSDRGIHQLLSQTIGTGPTGTRFTNDHQTNRAVEILVGPMMILHQSLNRSAPSGGHQ